MGGVKVFSFNPTMAQICWRKPFNSSVDVVAYNPAGSMLAVASHEQVIEILNVRKDYSRICRCVGHSSAIKHLDWSVDGSVIRSMC